ncbi:MAG: hypothetical protein ACRELA_04655 [Candidatus Rokuibacteriota bacterium]
MNDASWSDRGVSHADAGRRQEQPRRPAPGKRIYDIRESSHGEWLPFIWVIGTSIKPNSEIYALNKQFLPKAPTLEHFVKVVRNGDQLPSYVLAIRLD